MPFVRFAPSRLRASLLTVVVSTITAQFGHADEAPKDLPKPHECRFTELPITID